jgi:predicted CXXCH cytochrome family protein
VNGLLLPASVLLFATQLQAASVIGSRHDMNRFAASHVCEACHTPQHPNAIPPPPHWARAETIPVFPLYGSPPMETTVSQPGVASRICLSCHDGVNASSRIEDLSVSTGNDLVFRSGTDAPDATPYRKCKSCGRGNGSTGGRTPVFGPDFSSVHPISMPYPEAAHAPDLVAPPDTLNGWVGLSQYGVRLYGGGIECGSCHNVHDPGTDGHFLRTSMADSRLCLTCHNK